MTKRSAVERPKYITLTLAVYKNDTEPRIELVKQANSDEAPDFVNQWVRWGCGPRAGQGLLLAAKSHAGLSGRDEATFADVRKFVHPVLRHRMGLNFAAVSEGQTSCFPQHKCYL